MMSVGEAASSSYYGDAKNYYETDALTAPVWFGRGAEALGLLNGPLDSATYDKIYEGILPTGEVLGRKIGNVREHEPGWDLTFSAPKSVSLMALVGGDQRLLEAIRESAKVAMTWVEENASISRFTENGKAVPRLTGNLVAGMYMHDMSRAGDPHAHVHFPIMNVTQGPDGKMRSLDGRVFYRLDKDPGLVFQNDLALKVRDLGWEIDVNAKKGTFELAGFPQAVIDDFSKRKGEIIAHLEAKGLTGETATTLERKAAAVETRGPKEKNLDRSMQAEAWRRVMAEHGMDLKGMIANAEARAGDSAFHQGNQSKTRDEAMDAVRTAAQILSEQNIVFKDVVLMRRAETQAQGRADRHAIRGAIRELDQNGFLQAREVRHYDFVSGDHISVQGWTTAEAIAIENETLDHERRGRREATPMLAASAAYAVTREAGEQVSDWQPGHEKALFGLLTSTDRIVAVDAPLGSASARHVVGTYLNKAADHGFDVRLMTPSASGATAMASLMGTPAKTVAAHLWAKKREGKEDRRGWLDRYLNPKHGEVWLVGDAARLRPSGMRDLLKAAADHEARVVLMDQSHEGKTFGARSFEQLRDAGMMTFQLPEHQEAAKEDMRLAVAAFAKNEPALAFDYIRKAGGQIIAIAAGSRSIPDQVAAMHERRQWIADRYADLTSEERVKTRVFELTHRGKEALNNAIRHEMLEKGDLTGPAIKTDVLLVKSLTDTARKQALSYEQNDIVRFATGHRRSDQPEIKGGEYLRVDQVQAESGKVILEKADGRQVTWEPGRWGSDSAATYRSAERELAVGERIVWTRTDRALGVASQQRDTIVSIEPERGSISVERGNQIKTINLAEARHLEHAYVEVVQSHLTPAERVIAHVPADNTELANLQMLATIAIQSNNDLTIVTENSDRLPQVAEDRSGRASAALDGATSASGAGVDAVRTAADILAERSAIFPDKDLQLLAQKQGLGAVASDEINEIIRDFVERGELVGRTAKVYDPDNHRLVPGPGWTTLDAIGNEEKMLAAEMRGRDVPSGQSILSAHDSVKFVHTAAAEAVKRTPDKPWNHDQWTAAIGLLSSSHRVAGLQGAAGTAKTTTVLATLAKVAEMQGHEVVPMAQTSTAALTLGKALTKALGHETKGKTVAQHLGDVTRIKPADAEKAPIWIADEAGFIGSKDMRDLIRLAEQHQARLFLVFDVLQLGSVGAGRAVGQLVEKGMETYYLSEIVRQSNPAMREAVYDTIAQQHERALRQIQRAGGKVLEIPSEKERYNAIAKDYVSRSPDEREKTIVIEPTRNGVDKVTKQIRKHLGEQRDLTGRVLKAALLEDANMTRPEMATSINYQRGQVVRFPRGASIGDQAKIERGSYLVVGSIERGVVKLHDEANQRSILWEPRLQPLKVEVYDQKEHALRKGEWICWTRSMPEIGAIRGQRATILAVDRDNKQIDVQTHDGSRHQLDLRNRDHQAFSHGYALTAQKAQGATGPVIIHAASKHVNTVHDTFFYVGTSRPEDTATVFTDSKKDLIEGLNERSGRQAAALDAAHEAGGIAEQVVRDMAAAKFAEMQMAPATKEQTITPERTLGGKGWGMEM